MADCKAFLSLLIVMHGWHNVQYSNILTLTEKHSKNWKYWFVKRDVNCKFNREMVNFYRKRIIQCSKSGLKDLKVILIGITRDS